MRRAFDSLVQRARADHHDLFSASRWEEVASASTHFFGAALALAALVLGVDYAAQFESALAVVGATVYGATLVFLFVVSALYHTIPKPRAKRLLLVLDHCAIFLLIAGTYTPITLVILQGWQGWFLPRMEPGPDRLSPEADLAPIHASGVLPSLPRYGVDRILLF
jgi:predicted membrane channel-forming protein YqfA (hemolysin III family)